MKRVVINRTGRPLGRALLAFSLSLKIPRATRDLDAQGEISVVRHVVRELAEHRRAELLKGNQSVNHAEREKRRGVNATLLRKPV